MKLVVFAALLAIIVFQAEASSCRGKTVKVYLSHGYHLTGRRNFAPDPIVLVRIGAEVHRSKSSQLKRNPIASKWLQTMEFQTVSTNEMTVEVLDHNKITMDNIMGVCKVKMVSPGAAVKCQLQNNKGFLKFSYSCSP